MKLEDMIKKVETVERDAYQLCQKMSDLRVLIVGVYDDRDWWREKYYECLGEPISDKEVQTSKVKCIFCGIYMKVGKDGRNYCPQCNLEEL